ncbi:MAG: right-handed parallel beta-helix repeat-containing protein [Bacteroidota bacterium]|nr:right-handed parallel beta-helix repeat-containing protein [Bacteroidota bacterium]
MRTILPFLMVLAVLFSCAKEMEDPVQPTQKKAQTYTLSVTAGKGQDTKALELDGNKLKAGWTAGDTVRVYKGVAFMGNLIAQAGGKQTVLSGTVSGPIAKDDILTLKFLSPDYTHQDGTIEYIASHCDYAQASITVTDIQDESVTTTAASFANQQAIVKFMLRNSDNSADLEAKPLTIVLPDQTITVTPASASSEMFVAIPALASQALSLKAAVGNTLYIKDIASATLEAGKYYNITVKLLETVIAVVHNQAELEAAVLVDHAQILFANDISINSLLEIKNSRTIVIDMNGFTLDRGCTSRSSQAIVVRTGSTLSLSNGTVTGGWGGNGGALDIEDGTTMNLTDVIITGNHADDRGGGISIRSGGTLNMTGGAITNNVSRDKSGTPAGGGGLFIYSGSTATLTGVTISGNEAEVYGGGGIDNFGTLSLSGCTITGNTSKANGAGIWTSGSSTLNIQGANNIKDNCKTNALRSNLFLASGAVINITGALADDSKVFVSMETLGTFTNGYSTYNDGHPAGFFTADKQSITGMRLVAGEAQLNNAIPEGGVYYIERSWNETTKRVEATYHTLEENQYITLTGSDDDTYLDPGWYAVKGSDVVYDDFLYMNGGGEYHLILCDGASIKAMFFIVESPNILHIHGQADDNGKMISTYEYNATPHKCAGIGGTNHNANGPIFIHGGDIDVHTTLSAAGIGGGGYTSQGGPITIYGGTVHTEGGWEPGGNAGETTGGGAGIGGGRNGDGGVVNIYGGSVYATGRGSTTGGAGIGSGSYADNSGTISIYGGYVEAKGYYGSAGIGGGTGTNGADVTIHGGTVKAEGKSEGPGIGAGKNDEERITYAGTLTVTGGKVYAYGAQRGAGIGGGWSTNGSSVTVGGGYVYAEGGQYAAGIGSGCEHSSGEMLHGGTLTVTGGYVEAHGGEDGAGIGGGEDADGGTIIISGGEVHAYGSYGGAGIGGGEDGKGGNVTITGGTVIAQAGKDDTGYRAIGPGLGSDNYGQLELGPLMMVSSERLAYEVERINMCWYRTRVRVEPCTHPGYTAATCPYCKH